MILIKRLAEFLIFSGRVVWTGLHFSATIHRNWIDFLFEIQCFTGMGP
jgi:hypothetical protein